jgi:hypothetical protein
MVDLPEKKRKETGRQKIGRNNQSACRVGSTTGGSGIRNDLF